jgi:hypothetical protein
MPLPERKNAISPKKLPDLPKSWSELSWQQLCDCWRTKIRYGGNADVARVAALLSLLGLTGQPHTVFHTYTGETLYRLRDTDGCIWTATAREVAQISKQALAWFDYPYGDPGEKEQTDDKGKIIKEGREPVMGYVGPMHDALELPIEHISLKAPFFRNRDFALPQIACNNLTWQQYRILQNISPQLFSGTTDDATAVGLQAKFLANCLVPRSFSFLDISGGGVRIRPHYEYRYDAAQADGLEKWFVKRMTEKQTSQLLTIVFHVCFQTYQTALAYYAAVYPLLFSGENRNEGVRDALQGEVGTINTIMKYAGYTEQQQVYDSNVPFVLDILNSMSKEAKEIEKMNAKVKRK